MKHLRGVSVRYSEANLLLLSLPPNDKIRNHLIANRKLPINETEKYRPVLHYKNKLNILQHRNHLINL